MLPPRSRARCHPQQAGHYRLPAGYLYFEVYVVHVIGGVWACGSEGGHTALYVSHRYVTRVGV